MLKNLVEQKGANDLKIGGLVKFTTIDYPEHLAAVIFCQGCPWACRYCYNSHLIPPVIPEKSKIYSWAFIKDFLNKRRTLLDAVVFSGGEPTFQKALLPAILAVKELGFLAALHTSGAYPKQLSRILPFLDWVGLDIKAPFDQYERVTGNKRGGINARKSLEILLKSKVPFECRTTVHGELLQETELLLIAKELSIYGVTHYHLQAAQTDTVLDKTLKPFVWEETAKNRLLTALSPLFSVFSIRGMEWNSVTPRLR
ncbi:MAG: anaerobic ribonucleoside-triphosphate reductase activating protein [Gammaproteobacteria bacterium]|nr:anaerobic ribonucleoside-triphosphate reductase activating protein [Gammaproteobacteria bacterium]